MNSRPTGVSRRAVATGLAWSVPAVSFVAAAPSQAISPSMTASYYFAGSIDTTYGFGDLCEEQAGYSLVGLDLDNQTGADSGRPLGFAVVQGQASDESGQVSPKTIATLESPVQLVVAYPVGLIDLQTEGSAFTFLYGTELNWSAPVHTTATLKDFENDEGVYDVFTFTWNGVVSQSTLEPQTIEGQAQEGWEATALNGSWRINPNVCIETGPVFFGDYFAGGSTDLGDRGSFTTANGFTGDVVSTVPDTGGWHTYPLPRG